MSIFQFLVDFSVCKDQNYLIKWCSQSKFRSATKFFGSPNFQVYSDFFNLVIIFLFVEIFPSYHRLITFFPDVIAKNENFFVNNFANSIWKPISRLNRSVWKGRISTFDPPLNAQGSVLFSSFQISAVRHFWKHLIDFLEQKCDHKIPEYGL